MLKGIKQQICLDDDGKAAWFAVAVVVVFVLACVWAARP